MRAVILAAGYGTRLERDLRNDESGQYTHLIGVPKPLLPIGEMPLISHWIQVFEKVPEVTTIVVVVNDLHKDLYTQWAETLQKDVVIISDGSKCNEQRQGAVACMEIGINQTLEDTLFIAGDTLLKEDFNLESMINKFHCLQKQQTEACLILSAPVSEENVSKHGIIEVAENGLVTGFIEKPLPTETTSRLQCPCVYLISGTSLRHLKEFLAQKKDQPLSSRDATGMFIAELVHRAPVYAYPVEGRYDVGGLQSYIQCQQDFLRV